MRSELPAFTAVSVERLSLSARHCGCGWLSKMKCFGTVAGRQIPTKHWGNLPLLAILTEVGASLCLMGGPGLLGKEHGSLGKSRIWLIPRYSHCQCGAPLFSHEIHLLTMGPATKIQTNLPHRVFVKITQGGDAAWGKGRL